MTSQTHMIHRACLVCYPVLYPGMLALCGWRCRGVLQHESDNVCIVCEDLKQTHSEQHSGKE